MGFVCLFVFGWGLEWRFACFLVFSKGGYKSESGVCTDSHTRPARVEQGPGGRAAPPGGGGAGPGEWGVRIKQNARKWQLQGQRGTTASPPLKPYGLNVN